MAEEIFIIPTGKDDIPRKFRAVELISGAAGTALPREFAEEYPPVNWLGKEVGWHYARYDHGVLLDEDHPDYMKVWAEDVMDEAHYLDEDGTRWTLYQDEGGNNLWRITLLKPNLDLAEVRELPDMTLSLADLAEYVPYGTAVEDFDLEAVAYSLSEALQDTVWGATLRTVLEDYQPPIEAPSYHGAGIIDGFPVHETDSQYAVRVGGVDPPGSHYEPEEMAAFNAAEGAYHKAVAAHNANDTALTRQARRQAFETYRNAWARLYAPGEQED